MFNKHASSLNFKNSINCVKTVINLFLNILAIDQ